MDSIYFIDDKLRNSYIKKRMCQPNATKLVSIAKVRPILCKDSANRAQYKMKDARLSFLLPRCSLSFIYFYLKGIASNHLPTPCLRTTTKSPSETKGKAGTCRIIVVFQRISLLCIEKVVILQRFSTQPLSGCRVPR